jgi:hypothetical protein
MKFSHSLQFNSVPDWSSHYLAYSNLKKLIYTLEQRAHQQTGQPDAESSPLLNGQAEEPDKVFGNALDQELEKVCSFYQLKELEIYGELDHLLKDEENYEEEQGEFEHEQDSLPPGKKTRSASIFRNIGYKARRSSTMSHSSGILEEEDEDGDSDDDANETSQLRKKSPDGRRRRSAWDSQHHDDMHASTDFASSKRRTSAAFDDYNDMAFSALYDEGLSLKKRTASLYVTLCELRSFIQLNRTGFSKVLKKYDKILDRKLKSTYLPKYVEPAYPFQQSTMNNLAGNISRVESVYARICTKGDVAEAKRELRLHLREHVVWERNTVWREMIGIERKAQAANLGIGQILGRKTDPRKVRLQGDEDEPEMKEVETPIGRYRCPRWLLSSTFYFLVGILAIFFVLLFVPIMERPEQQNCLALVIFVSLLWATEVRTCACARASILTLSGHSALRDLAARSVLGCNSARRPE